MLEKYLIWYCAPTLASLKTASLFRYPFSSPENLQTEVSVWNSILEQKGIAVSVLRCHKRMALIYVYRITQLQKDLQKTGVPAFLAEYGYPDLKPEALLSRLKYQLENNASFPHEIGIFLGYPLGDVVGFIQNMGHNFKYSGCWKVYCNEVETIKLFRKLKKCRLVYLRLWNQGRSILKLTVTA